MVPTVQRRSRKLRPLKLLPGLLEMLVLHAVWNRRLRPRDIVRWIFHETNETFEVKSGSVVSALNNLVIAGWIRKEPEDAKKKERFYQLSFEGRPKVQKERMRWQRIVGGVSVAIKKRGAQPGDKDFYRMVPRVWRRRLIELELDAESRV